MTERKPPGMSFTSWVDKQIHEAMERGAFDNLPGAGQPLPNRGEEDPADAWLRDYLRREGVSTEEMLPTPLKLRKEIDRLDQNVQVLGTESDVREVVAELNERIMKWRRIPIGPPIFVPLADEQKMVSKWRAAHPLPSPAGHDADLPAGSTPTTSSRRRWRQRPDRS